MRAYAFDLLNFLRFCAARALVLGRVSAVDLFDYLDWQANPAKEAEQRVVRLRRQPGAAPATINRRIAAVRGLFEYLMMTGLRADNPVPAARRSSGLRASRAKHTGRSFAPAAAAIYPLELAELHAAATRLGWGLGWTAAVLGGGLPLAIAVTGDSPSLLTQAAIDAVREAVRTSPYYTATVRHSQLSQLHSLARLLYEAGVLPAPPIHRRGDGPGNLESRLAVVGAPEIRRVMLAYLRAKQAVLKAHSIRNLTSHLAAFGEFLTRDYPTLTSVSLLRREHIEAYCAFVPTRRWRGQRASDKQIGSSSIIAGLIAVRGFLDDIAAWGWAEAPTRRLMFASDVPARHASCPGRYRLTSTPPSWPPWRTCPTCSPEPA